MCKSQMSTCFSFSCMLMESQFRFDCLLNLFHPFRVCHFKLACPSPKTHVFLPPLASIVKLQTRVPVDRIRCQRLKLHISFSIHLDIQYAPSILHGGFGHPAVHALFDKLHCRLSCQCFRLVHSSPSIRRHLRYRFRLPAHPQSMWSLNDAFIGIFNVAYL